MIFDKYIINKKLQYVGENLLKAQEILNLMNSETGGVLLEEAIITPYYIDNRKRYELYQYEFYLTNEGFLEFLERKTGKKPELVDREIFKLRAMCFANLKDGEDVVFKNIRNYFDFLLSNQDVQQEITKLFGSYEKEKLFVEVY